MLDAAPTKPKQTDIIYVPQKANDCIADVSRYKPPEKLFDEFWREGELSLMFGASGTGKTVLAVQIAEALARGRGIDGFAMPARRRRVLYVDLVHSGEQFHARRLGAKGRFYKFSENFHRDRPDDEAKLVEWLRVVIAGEGYKVVIIDDLTALRSTPDGTRETLKIMRDLRRLTNELGVSILVISPSREPRPGRRACESDLMRARIACDVADSVFAVGRHERQPEWLYLAQVRSRGSAIYWDRDNTPYARIGRGADGLLTMQFDDRFEPKMDAETRRRIIELKAMNRRYSIRELGEMTGLGRSRVERLLKKWRSSMQAETDEMAGQIAEDEAGNAEADDSYADGPIDADEDLLPADEAPLLDAEDAARYGIDIDETISTPFPSQTSQTSQTSSTSQTSPTSQTSSTSQTFPTSSTSPTSFTSSTSMTQDEIFEACGCVRGQDSNGNFVWVEKTDARGRLLITYQPGPVGYTRWKYATLGKMGMNPIHGPVHVRWDFT